MGLEIAGKNVMHGSRASTEMCAHFAPGNREDPEREFMLKPS